ncbi:MAG TPA: type IV secretory system conjugative DNA transfer family protein [Solirubrobacteraceae bacterium]|nr:type IV secretory system conjugative DNA transfer family protein [Solirubrobacteraceae bacterium]
MLLPIVIFGVASGGWDRLSSAKIAVGIGWVVLIALAALPAGVQRRLLAPIRGGRGAGSRRRPPADPLTAVRQSAWADGGGVYLGVGREGRVRHARAERAVLLLGPPRAGKTSGVIVPAVVAHTGPVVSTSTKGDVARATRPARSGSGRTWVFDPTGAAGAGEGNEELRWSPVTSSVRWDGAVLMARAMTTNIGAGTTDRSHWASRAQALLGPMLHAAAVHGRDMEAVVDWVMRHELDQPGILLEDERCSNLAFGSLLGLLNTEERERSSIFSAAADALQAYTSEHALAAARNPNFDPNGFVRSADTVYIHAPAEEQAAVAPIVCGLLSEIRRATYRAHANGELFGRMLFALDEVANIAPLEELPQIASEGGGQGLVLLAALQDLSQARQRWGAQADGFLTLFGTKLILPGVADARTLESISQTLGEYDREVVAHTRPQVGLFSPGGDNIPHRTRTVSTQRTRVLSPGEIANIPAGRALHIDGVKWELLTLTPAYSTEPWRTLTTNA